MSFKSSEYRILNSTRPNLPAGRHVDRVVNRRRIIFFGVNAVLYSAILLTIVLLLMSGGWSKSDFGVFLAAVFVIPPLLLLFTNSVLGFLLKRGAQGGLDRVAPHCLVQDKMTPLPKRTAILMLLRNDPVEAALHRFKLIRASLESTGEGGHFRFFVLSDTSDPVLAKHEEMLVAEWNRALPDFASVVYRRRLVNVGFKAGNLADFCRTWGDYFDCMVPLDPGSFMTGPAILEMARIMESNPKIGILQALAVHAPQGTAYARVNAFFARMTQHLTALGQAWWQADCAEYRGRNAIVRIQPFYLYCRVPSLPGHSPFGGSVFMHERIEAALMHRAGYDVRSLPIESDHYVDRPASVFEEMRRLRARHYALWQLPRLIGFKDVSLVYRMEWTIALIRGVAPFFLTLAIFSMAFKPFELHVPIGDVSIGSAKIAYTAIIFMILMPLLLGVFDRMLSPMRAASFGGFVRLICGAMIGALAYMLCLAPLAFRATFSLFASPFTRQNETGYRADIPPAEPRHSAFRAFWPASLFGVDLLLLMLLGDPVFALWSLPFTLGYLLVIPLVKLLSSSLVCRGLDRIGLFVVPEISDPPREILQLNGHHRDVNFDRAA